MTKRLRCGDLVDSCDHEMEGETEEEVMAQAAHHASVDLGMEVTPELARTVREKIRDV